MSVGRTTARAAIWAFLATAGSKVITLIGLGVLARLLAPNEFGLLAFALVYITYAETIGDLGSGMALVYWPDRREEAAQATFVINMAAGIFWFVLTLAIAPWVADFFNAPNGAPIVRVLALSFILKFAGNTHDALTQKDLKFKKRMVPDLAFAGLKAIISIALAWLGFGAWSLVWGQIAGVAARTLLLWIAVPWRPTFTYPRELITPMLGYGRGIVLANILGAITHHADLAIVGRFLGTTALGLYQMASKVPETSVIVILWVVGRVLFPAFSRIHAQGESLKRPYLTAGRYISAATMPIAIGLFVLAEPVVLVFLGDQWLAAAPILSALSLYAAMRCLSTHAGDVLKATGRASLLARISMVKALLIVPALAIGAMYDATAVAISLTMAAAVTTMITLVAASRIIGVKLSEIAASFLPSILASAAMAVPVKLFLEWADHLHPIAQIAISGVIGAAVYGIVLALLDRDLFRRAQQHFLPNTVTKRTV
jgi:PST family polysaccharide transporter